MRYAIIAAGEGSRLQQEGIESPKPLVRINGEHLIDRLLRIFMANDAEEIVVICRSVMQDVVSHLAHIQQEGLDGKPVPLRFIERNTPSSMHSFYELSKEFSSSDDSCFPFVLTTVDTIFRDEEFGSYISALKQVLAAGEDGLMGVTDYIDDEKPLYVETVSGASDKEQEASQWPRITGFLDTCEHPHFISGGIYGLTTRAITTLNACIERGESRMRNFQRALVRDGLLLRAYPFTKVLDIDHASDILKAEEFLSK
jgi:NDP-sugar pyrophosphorylase family protein